jgi:hypothetical protein
VPTTTEVTAKSAQLAPVDESVVVPRHVRAAAEKANAYYKPPPGDPQAAAPGAAPPTVPAGAPAPPPAAPPATPQPEPAPQQQNWEQAYKSMKGRYDKAAGVIQNLESQISQNAGEVMALQAVVADMQRQNQERAPTNEELRQRGRLITPEDEKEYGSDFIDVVRRAARDIAEPQVQALTSKVAELELELGKTSIQTIYDRLDQSVPNWRDINQHPRFVQWLKLRDPYSGAIKHQMLSAAFEAADAPRVIAFFKGFLSDEATVNPADPPPQPAPQARQPAMSLDSLAAPGRARTAPTTPAADKPAFTVADIRKFYDDVRKGYYAGREPDKVAIEHQIFAAQREGRVRG